MLTGGSDVGNPIQALRVIPFGPRPLEVAPLDGCLGEEEELDAFVIEEPGLSEAAAAGRTPVALGEIMDLQTAIAEEEVCDA
eukprot:15466972-Alexandrium_andersonii.AAC.1